jgi:hypothetical protein
VWCHHLGVASAFGYFVCGGVMSLLGSDVTIRVMVLGCVTWGCCVDSGLWHFCWVVATGKGFGVSICVLLAVG